MSPEVRKFFQDNGRKRGNALKEKFGSDYFRAMAAKRKTHGKQILKEATATPEE